MSEVDAWKDVALGEEAAVYAYGVLAARLPLGAERNRATDLVAAHSRARDAARAALAADDYDPAVPPAFEIPFPLTDAPAARRLAGLVESRLVDVYCRHLGAVEGDVRRTFAQAAAEASARAVTWGARPTAFPGGRDSEPAASAPASGGGATPTPTDPTATPPVAPTGPAGVSPDIVPGAVSDGASVSP